MKAKILFTAILIVGTLNLYCQIINIPEDQPTIQAGIDFAANGDTVLVAEDTYLENINFMGKAITVASNFILDGDTSHISNTIIDGSQPQNPDIGSVVTLESEEDTTSVLIGFTITGGTGTLTQEGNFDFKAGGGINFVRSGGKVLNNYIEYNIVNYQKFTIGAGITAGGPIDPLPWLVLRGNTIRYNESISQTEQANGGGVEIYYNLIMVDNEVNNNKAISPKLAVAGGVSIRGDFGHIDINVKNNLITQNKSVSNNILTDYSESGGLFIGLGCSGNVSNNIISFNEVEAPENTNCFGAGVAIVKTGPDLIFENNVITNNYYSGGYCFGGGLCIWFGGGNYQNNLIQNNLGSCGGGICVGNNNSDSIAVFINNTITENEGVYGGGLYLLEADALVINSILWNNEASEEGDEIYDLESNLDVRNSDVEYGWPGNGNIDKDPLFADPSSGDFHLTWANFPIPDETKSPCIDTGDPDYPFDPDGTIADMGAFYFNQYHTQQITLSPGFQFVSSHLYPVIPDMEVVVAEILNDNLVYVRNSEGAMLRKIGPNWVNGIGDWVGTEGYLIKYNGTGQFTISGDLIPAITPIDVTTGYQFVSYLPIVEIDATEAFASIIGDDLIYVRNSEGAMLRKIGPNWVNGIGNCVPNEGYLVKMAGDAVLIYPEGGKSSSKITATPTHFTFKGGNAADPVYTIYIAGLEIGVEIAAFDGDIMVGATRINSQNTFENELPVFSTLTNGTGYKNGNPITLKVWSENNIVATDFTMEAVYDSYVSDVYPEEDGKYSIVNITKGSIENMEEAISVYPNPSEGIFNILFEGVRGDMQIKVLDLIGKEYSNFELNGSASTQLDLTELAVGVYFISFSCKDFSQVKKIVIQ